MGGNLQEGVALRDASYFESTVTAGDMRSFQASSMDNFGGGLAFRLLGELAEEPGASSRWRMKQILACSIFAGNVREWFQMDKKS